MQVIQRRFDGSKNFYRNWTEYKEGFGDLSGEFWFGNDNLHQLTKDGNYKLKIELIDKDGTVAVVEYGTFIIGDETSYYTLKVDEYFANNRIPGKSCKHHCIAIQYDNYLSQISKVEYQKY